MEARLILEDGSVFIGEAFGALRETCGEVVFNTGMTGYQEILSDPSYCGQIITMTYPLIGNYGINPEDFEAQRPSAYGMVVKECCELPSNWRSRESLADFLKRFDIPGIAGVDTRKLTRLIRNYGTMKGIITTSQAPAAEIMSKLQIPLRRNQVELVSTHDTYTCPGRGLRIVLMDFGLKRGILRELLCRHCEVVVVPYNLSVEKIRELNPDGILLSNGPGDPKDVSVAINTISKIMGECPIFGICLGHQVVALACGADTRKMKFGHRGSNHPVKNLGTNRVYITSQNHSYTVKEDSLKGTGLEISHIAVNDGTVEGLKHQFFPAFSVQYHPEAAPGPEDSGYLFDEFLELISSWQRGKRYA